MKDGESVPLQDDFEFPNGSHVSADGYLHGGSGTRRKLLDGEMIELTGKTIPANDTVLLKDGKVIVQKDGSLLELAPSSSLMMNDGTKVFGDGSVLGKDGVKKPLLAGEILKLQGVMPK